MTSSKVTLFLWVLVRVEDDVEMDGWMAAGMGSVVGVVVVVAALEVAALEVSALVVAAAMIEGLGPAMRWDDDDDDDDA